MLHTQRNSQLTTIRIEGRFDFRSVKDFHAALAEPSPAWSIDMTDVNYIDSAALGLLLLLRDKAGGDDAKITLLRVNGQPREVLKMVKFDRLFRLADV